jgi:HEAT repeat protein
VSLLKSIALDDRSTTVQLEAIETLGDLPDGAGIDALVDLARDHPMANMRKEALEALVDSDHPKARAVLDRALRRPPGR